MEIYHSAAYQKRCKISMSSDSSLSQDSPMVDGRLPGGDWLAGFMEGLKSRLASRVPLPGLLASGRSLKRLVELLCEEFDRVGSGQVYLDCFNGGSVDEVSVNLMKVSLKDPIARVLNTPERGLYLSKDDCRSLSALIVGAFRDSAVHGLKERVRELQGKVISFATVNLELKKELAVLAGINEGFRDQADVKDCEIELIVDKIKELEKKLLD